MLDSTAKFRALFLEISMELYSMRDRNIFLDRVADVLSRVMRYSKVYLFLRETPDGPMCLRIFRGKHVGEKAINDFTVTSGSRPGLNYRQLYQGRPGGASR